jgi:hypothetical protein
MRIFQDTLADKLEARKEEKQQQMTETRTQIAGMEAEMKVIFRFELGEPKFLKQSTSS